MLPLPPGAVIPRGQDDAGWQRFVLGRVSILRFTAARRMFSSFQYPKAVIPANFSSFRRKPESMLAGSVTVVGDTALDSGGFSSFRLAPESMLAGSITVVGDTALDSGFRRNDGPRGIAMMKTYAGLW